MSIQNPLLYFNSQPHKEADVAEGIIYDMFSISTHSLTRRLTDSADEAQKELKKFQLTASQGG